MTRRTDRLGVQFREILGELLVRSVKDPRVGFVTITTVRVTPDLSKAHVYYSTMGDREETQQGLQRAAGFLRTETGRQVRLRALPELIFHYDDSYDRGHRVDEIIHGLHPPEPQAPDDDEASGLEEDDE